MNKLYTIKPIEWRDEDGAHYSALCGIFCFDIKLNKNSSHWELRTLIDDADKTKIDYFTSAEIAKSYAEIWLYERVRTCLTAFGYLTETGLSDISAGYMKIKRMKYYED